MLLVASPLAMSSWRSNSCAEVVADDRGWTLSLLCKLSFSLIDLFIHSKPFCASTCFLFSQWRGTNEYVDFSAGNYTNIGFYTSDCSGASHQLNHYLAYAPGGYDDGWAICVAHGGANSDMVYLMNNVYECYS